mmetsp:Transcript_37299/g.70052  ORF Transcript_37299/g.70052 Transcript_37299/m.70052 type:complete len:144 (+) Transcript_37299:187-618(+)
MEDGDKLKACLRIIQQWHFQQESAAAASYINLSSKLYHLCSNCKLALPPLGGDIVLILCELLSCQYPLFPIKSLVLCIGDLETRLSLPRMQITLCSVEGFGVEDLSLEFGFMCDVDGRLSSNLLMDALAKPVEFLLNSLAEAS